MLALARATHLTIFAIAGGGLLLCLAMFWIVVASRTVHGAWNRTLFFAPCLSDAKLTARFEADAV